MTFTEEQQKWLQKQANREKCSVEDVIRYAVDFLRRAVEDQERRNWGGGLI